MAGEVACSTVNYCLFANNTCEDEDFSDIVGCDAMVIDGEKVFGGKSIFSDCLSTRKSKRCVLRYGISLFLQRDEWIPRGMKTVYVREKERLMEDRSINSFDEEASVGCGITKESPCNLLSEGIQQCGISLPCTLIALQGSIRGDDSLGDLSNQLSIIGAGKELSSIYPRLARGGTFFIHIDSNAALISDISIVYDPSMNSNVDGSLFFINSVDTYDESVATHFSSQYSSADSSQLQRSFTFVKPHSSKTTSELAKSRIHTSLDKSSFTSPQFKSGCNVPLHSTPNRLSTDKFAFILSNVSILTPSDINVSLRNPLFLVISGSISANCLKLSSFISSDSALFSMSPPHSEIANAYNIHFIFANSEIEAYSGSTKPVISLKESEDFSNDPQTELEFINSTFSDCRAAQSSFGGICCVRICSNEKLSVIDCQCHNCVCSETVGKGGCFCVITPSQGENFDLLHIFFKRLSVKGNVAKYGKNIFVQCNSLERQLTASMFRINFDGEEVDWSNSIVGSDSTNAFLDIYELQIKNFYSDTSVCVDGKLGKEVANCGTEIIPCKTLSNGLTHLQMKNIVSNDESLCANLKSPACSPEHFSSRASEADICHLSIMNSVSIGSEITILNAELEGSGANPELLLDAVCVSENVDDGVICCGGITTLKSFTVLEKESFESDRDSIFSEFDSTLTFSSMKINLFISNRLSLLLKMNSGKAFLNQVFIETFFKIGPVIDCYDIKNLEIHNCTFNMKGTMFPILRIKNNVEVPFPQFLNVTKTNFATGLSSASFYTSHIVVEVKDTEKYYRSTSNRKMSVLIQHSNFSSPTLKSCVSLQCCNISMKSVNFSHSLNDSADIYNANFIDVADISNSHMQKTMIDYQSCISSIKSCQWTEAFLMLENSEGKIEEISFSGANFTQIQDLGGICIKAGDIALNSVKFISLNSSLTEYQSMRLHMSCGSAAKLQLTDIQADIPSSQNCLWISNVDCSISGPAVTPGISVFFLPVISSVTFVALENRLRFTVNGEMLIPCGLSLELLFEADNISKIESVADVTTANDHQLIFYTNNSIFNDSPPNESISLRMAVKTDIMNGISYSSPFVLKEKKYDPNNPVSPRNRRDGIIVLSILLPIFFLKICASLFLFFAYRRRRIKKSKEMFQKKVQEIFIAQQNAENYSSNKKKQKAYEISSNDSESNSFLLPADEQEPFFEDD